MPTEAGDYGHGVYGGGLYGIGFDPAAFVFQFDVYYPLTLTHSTLIQNLENGTEQRIRLMASGIANLEAIEFQMDGNRKLEVEELHRFNRGSVGEFDLADPVIGSNRRVRFTDDQLELTKTTANRWNWTARFTEVRK